MKFSSCLKWIAPVAFCLGFSLVAGTSAQAGEMRKSRDETRTVYLVKYRVNGMVRYNKNPAMVRKVSFFQYQQSNPYVCTPSGFGQKSRCYMRTFKQPDV
jgi:site-specific DNA-adenine methylase